MTQISEKLLALSTTTRRRPIGSILSLCMVAGIAATIAGFSQEATTTPIPVAPTLPVSRTLTAADGRKLEATITAKTATAIKGKTAAGKEFTLELSKLSAEDQAFVATTRNIRVLYIGLQDDIYKSLTPLKETGFDIVSADVLELRKRIKAGDVSMLKDYDVIWNEGAGETNIPGTDSLIAQEANKLNQILVVSSLKMKTKADLLANTKTEEPDTKKAKKDKSLIYSKVDENFILFFPAEMVKHHFQYDPKVISGVIVNLQELIKTHHR